MTDVIVPVADAVRGLCPPVEPAAGMKKKKVALSA
jgi:hypothetical protein